MRYGFYLKDGEGQEAGRSRQTFGKAERKKESKERPISIKTGGGTGAYRRQKRANGVATLPHERETYWKGVAGERNDEHDEGRK